MTRPTPPRLLTIAGSDSGGGAGIQADLKTFAAHGAYGMSVVTALTAQNTREVRAVLEVAPAMVAAQIDAVLDDIGADAVKIGMLASAAIVRAVAGRLASLSRAASRLPVVLDPVMVAKSGDRCCATTPSRRSPPDLLPLATVVTPNLPELEAAGGTAAARSTGGGAAAARPLALAAAAGRGRRCSPREGMRAGAEVVDLLLFPGGETRSTLLPPPPRHPLDPRHRLHPRRRRSPPGWERGRSCRRRSAGRSNTWRAPSRPPIPWAPGTARWITLSTVVGREARAMRE